MSDPFADLALHGTAPTPDPFADLALAPKAPFLSRLGHAALQMVEHPLETVEGLAKAPFQSLAAATAPVIGETQAQRPWFDYGPGYNPADRQQAAPGQAITAANTKGAIAPQAQRAGMRQTVANLAAAPLAAIPVVGPAVAGAVAGAAYDPEDPWVGAVLGGGLGGALHAAGPVSRAVAGHILPDLGGAVPDAFADLARESKGTPPAPESAANALFAARLGLAQPAAGIPDAAAVEARVPPTPPAPDAVDFFNTLANQPTAAEAAQIAKAKPLPGLVSDLAAADAERAAQTAAYRAQGFVRRPAATLPEEAPAVESPTEAAAAPVAPHDAFADLALSAPTPASPEAFPEGFTMGGSLQESRIPAVATPPARGNPEVPGTWVTPEVASALGAEVAAPETAFPAMHGTPKGVGASDLVNPNAFAPAIQAHPDLFDEAMARASANGLDKGYVPFSEQQKVAQSFADAVGLDRLQVDRKALMRLSGQQIVGLKQALTTNLDNLEAFSRVANDAQASAADRAQAQAAITQLQAKNEHLLAGIVHGSSELGRGLGFLRQIARRSLDPDVWVIQAQRLAGETPLSDEVIMNIRKLAREAAEACGA